VLRGDVHRFRLPEGVGQDQHGDRFAVIVQADEFLSKSVVIVAPTSRSARPASFRPEAEIEGETTRVLVEQLGAVGARRLGALVGHLTHEELWGVDEALLAVLGLR
jgi:mRNA interferase MazF